MEELGAKEQTLWPHVCDVKERTPKRKRSGLTCAMQPLQVRGPPSAAKLVLAVMRYRDASVLIWSIVLP